MKCLLAIVALFSLSATTIDEMVQRRVDAFCKKEGVSGLAATIVYQDQTAIGVVKDSIVTHGTISKRSHIAVNGHTLFRIGPLTRSMTGALLAWMVKEGKTTLEAPAETCVPRSLPMPSYDGSPIRLVDLATSTSGLPDMSYDLDTRSAVGISKLFRLLREWHLKEVPGSTYFDSNVGYALLANLLARLGRSDYINLINDTILAPLRMIDTTCSPNRDQKRRCAAGYEGEEAILSHLYERRYSAFIGAGGLFSTADDMKMWLLFNLRIFTGHLAPILPIMHAKRVAIGDGKHVCLGLHADALPMGTLYSQGGSQFGYSSHVAFIPEKGCGVAILSNNGLVDMAPLSNELLRIIMH